jgi:hypothetical protein
MVTEVGRKATHDGLEFTPGAGQVIFVAAPS